MDHVRRSISRLLPKPPNTNGPGRANCVESFEEAGGLAGLE